MAFCFVFVAVGVGMPIGEHFFGWEVKGSPAAKIIVPVMFTLMGAGGMWVGYRMFRGNIGSVSDVAGIPPVLKDAVRSRTGQLRLSPVVSNRTFFVGVLCVALFWNGLTWFMIAMMWQDMDGGIKWGGLLFMSAFAIVGLVLLWGAIHAFLKMILTGNTFLTANAQTLPPGAPLDFTVHQAGRFTIDDLTVKLVCQETAKYRRGTDTVTKKEIVREVAICSMRNLTARGGQMLTRQTVTIPPDAMHSFYSSNNQIDWLLQVKMTLKGRPDVDQMFRLRVLPQVIINQEANRRG